ncbi:multidrug transporter [Fusarium flagelliforme]|uniref:Multidrug transporter n=1 Tax=Fusarium flagelliforme TaxID=2675880 RepID=A0A395MC96_9HYPO|nr:multidrug transporter [Fusarium flagelliforme]
MADGVFSIKREVYETEDGMVPVLVRGPDPDSDPATLEDVESDMVHQMSRWRRLGILAVLNIVTAIAAFDATCICVILPHQSIARELDASFSMSLSMGAAVLLASAISQPLFAEAAHVFGRRPAYLAALALFITGSLLSCFAKNAGMLLAGRTTQGIGSGGPVALSNLVTADLYTARKRFGSFAYQNMFWAMGTVSGPLVGGAIVQTKDSAWRYIYWGTLPFLALSFAGSWALMGYDKHHRNIRDIKNFDWGGAFLYIASSVCLVLPLSWGGSVYPWKSAAVIVPFTICVLSFISLWVYEKKIERPMFRKSLFRSPSTICHLAMAVLHGLLMWMVLYYLAVYYMGVKYKTPLMTGVWALPATLTVAPMAALVGLVTSKTGRYQGFLVGGWTLLVTIFGALTILDKDSSAGTILVLVMFLGTAMGFLLPVNSIGVTATCDKQDAGHGMAMIVVLRTLGQCLGIAVGMSIFSTQLAKELNSVGLIKVPVNDAIQLMRASMESQAAHSTFMSMAVAASLKKVWMAGSVMAGLGLILAIFARSPRLPRDSVPDEKGKGKELELEQEKVEPGAECNLKHSVAGQVWLWLRPCLRRKTSLEQSNSP